MRKNYDESIFMMNNPFKYFSMINIKMNIGIKRLISNNPIKRNEKQMKINDKTKKNIYLSLVICFKA